MKLKKFKKRKKKGRFDFITKIKILNKKINRSNINKYLFKNKKRTFLHKRMPEKERKNQKKFKDKRTKITIRLTKLY